MKNKMKFTWLGVNFELPSESLRTTNYWGEKLENPYISVGRKEVPLLFKQYVKVKYPNLLVWGSSRTFANGSSSDLNVCNPDGSDLSYDSPIYNELRGFSDMMKGGRYDGMHDIYEDAVSGKSDNGTTLEFSSKYVHFEGKAPYGSWPEALRSLKAMIAGEYVWGPLTSLQAVEKLRGYKYSESVIEKALGNL